MIATEDYICSQCGKLNDNSKYICAECQGKGEIRVPDYEQQEWEQEEVENGF